jgi:hypothetical protein
MPKHVHPKRDEMGVFWIPADPELSCELKLIVNNYAGLQRFVGGYVQPYHAGWLELPELRCGCDLSLLVDEDAIMKRLPLNERASAIGSPSQPILGDCIIVARGPVGRDEYDFWGLPEYMNSWLGPGQPLPTLETF